METSYIVAARRTALGRIGGLHKNRRIETLAAPVVLAALEDSGLDSRRVDEIVIGNAMHGNNPARLIALASGLPETVPALTIDRQCASGLDAILYACRAIASGERDVIVAGGAESISTAPWRIAKPKSLYQLPHFIGVEPTIGEAAEEPQIHDASEDLSERLKIDRGQQDAWALKSHVRAATAREAKRFVGEIVPLRKNAEEARDQTAFADPSPDDLERLSPFTPPTGTLTLGNTSGLQDGAAIVIVVSETVWQELGRPAALQLAGSATQGVSAHDEAAAPIEVMKTLYGRVAGLNPKDIGVFEVSETSAAQAIAFGSLLGLDDDVINPDGGAVVRGHPFAAAGAVLVVRLFTRMVRDGSQPSPRYGVATLGALGGLGVAGLFERVS